MIKVVSTKTKRIYYFSFDQDVTDARPWWEAADIVLDLETNDVIKDRFGIFRKLVDWEKILDEEYGF